MFLLCCVCVVGCVLCCFVVCFGEFGVHVCCVTGFVCWGSVRVFVFVFVLGCVCFFVCVVLCLLFFVCAAFVCEFVFLFVCAGMSVK